MAWVFSARTESVLAPNPVVGNALILFAATLLGMRMVYTRQFVLRVPYARAVFWPMVGALPLFLLGDAAIADGMVRSESTWETWVALAYQGIVVGGAGQLAWVYLLRKHTPGTVIAFSFLTPVSGVAQGAAYFDEPVPARLVTGLAAGPRGHRSGGKVGAAGQAVRPDRRAAGFGRIAVRRSSSCRRRTPWGRTAQGSWSRRRTFPFRSLVMSTRRCESGSAPYRRDHPAARRELLHECLWNVGRRGRHDDPVVRARVRAIRDIRRHA